MKRLIAIVVLCFLTFSLILSCKQAETEINVVSVSISQPYAEMIVGETITLNATVSPSNATDKSVIWASSKQSVASIDESGIVTAISDGETIITATAGSKRDQCTIVVIEPITLKVNCITGEATEIESSSAKLSGIATIKNANEANASAYFYYSSSTNDVNIIINSGNRLNAGLVSNIGDSFIATLTNLKPETEYYYIAALCIDGQEFLGDIKHFTTKERAKELTVTGVATDITEWSAMITAYANPTPEMGAVTMGIVISTSSSPSLDNGIVFDSRELDGNNMYTVIANALASNTTYYYKSFVQYGGVYRYGEVKSFTTLEIMASIESHDVIHLTEFRATLNSKILLNSEQNLPKDLAYYYSDTDLDVSELTHKGIKVEATNDDDVFFREITDLIYNKEYYYVAVANVYDKEIIGDRASFRTKDITAMVETLPASSISETRATLKGQFSIDSEESLSVQVWFQYLKSESASVEEIIQSGTKKNITSYSDDGGFEHTISNLEYGATYSYIAYARVHDKTFYGDVSRFNTNVFDAIVQTEKASDITELTATVNGKLVINSQEDLQKSVWFLYCSSCIVNTRDDIITYGVKVGSYLSSDGTFKSTLSSLYYNTGYSYIAVAKVCDKEFYGEIETFTTTDFDANVTTGTATDISEFKATINGTLSIDSEASLNKSVWFRFSETASSLDDLLKSGTMRSGALQSDGTFSATLNNLKHNTQYFYVAVSKVQDREYYGSVQSFYTKDIDATVTTDNASNISMFAATINGSLTINSTESFNKSVWFLFSDNANSLSELLSSGTQYLANLSSDGNFSVAITSLADNTTYYYVAVAQVKDKVFYGDVNSFETLHYTVEAVDLGLSVKWASYNLGATKPEETGFYFSWGETEPKSEYSWQTYKWYDYSTQMFTKYCTKSSNGIVDNRTTLETGPNGDDVASKKLGDKWRIPTHSEWKELINNCSLSNATVNGVKGWLMTSKITGYTDKSIFFPVVGHKYSTYQTGDSYYWSSSLATNLQDPAYEAYAPQFDTNSLTGGGFVFDDHSESRYVGITVRPVKD